MTMNRQSHQELFAQFLVEHVRKELREAAQHFDDVERQIAVVAQRQQQRAHGRVHVFRVHVELAYEALHALLCSLLQLSVARLQPLVHRVEHLLALVSEVVVPRHRTCSRTSAMIQ